jgi:hypothetical protein
VLGILLKPSLRDFRTAPFASLAKWEAQLSKPNVALGVKDLAHYRESSPFFRREKERRRPSARRP